MCAYRSTYFSGVSRPLIAFPHDHRRNNGERKEPCRNDSHQSFERNWLSKAIEPTISSSQVLYAIDIGTGTITVKAKPNQLTSV